MIKTNIIKKAISLGLGEKLEQLDGSKARNTGQGKGSKYVATSQEKEMKDLTDDILKAKGLNRIAV